jgi:hypothetical protein
MLQYNLLLCGPPSSSKTLFLMGILDIRNDAVYFDGSNTTNRILDVLEAEALFTTKSKNSFSKPENEKPIYSC